MWINLILDFFAALVMATEPPSISSTKGEPPKNMKVLSLAIWRQIIVLSLYNIFVITILLLFGKSIAGLHNYNQYALLRDDICQAKKYDFN